MTFKTVLVHAGVDAEAPSRIHAALAVGARFGATIVGVGAVAWAPYVDPALGYADGETIQALRDGVDADVAQAEADFKAAVKGYAGAAVWRPVIDYPAKTLCKLACGADLVVASRVRPGADDRRTACPTDVVMGAGVPVLLTPRGAADVPASRVLVGWKNTRESRRAVGDALPFLRAAERVHVVQVAEKDAFGAGASELDDVVERLSRHGVFAEASTAPQLRATVAEELMDVAESRGCGLVVLGAYGHSRLREWAFGGVTADLLADADRPILFSR